MFVHCRARLCCKTYSVSQVGMVDKLDHLSGEIVPGCVDYNISSSRYVGPRVVSGSQADSGSGQHVRQDQGKIGPCLTRKQMYGAK